MFRSRSKFDNEAPMSRRGMRVGLVLTVALAMVAVLASTVGVLSSQSTAPSLTFVDASHGTFNDVPEGETFRITYTSSSSAGYALTLELDTIITPLAGFEFADDIEGDSFKVTPNMGSETTITTLPQTVSIESGTTMITITFKAANDLYVEQNESFTLKATPGSGSPKTTTITLQDPAAVTVGLSVDGATTITEGQTRNINITLSRPLTEFSDLSNSNPPSSYKRSSALPGSNYEDISTSGTQIYNSGDGHNREYFVTFTDGFEFEFFGGTYGDVSIGTNGYLKLGGPDNGAGAIFVLEDNFADQEYSNGSTNDRPIVAPFWIDLDLRTTGGSLHREVRGVAPNRRFIVQYTNVEYRPGGAARGRATFQVVLFETTGQIEFRYESISDNQNGAAVGITDGSGTDYAEVGIGQSTTTRVVDDNTRIIFTPDINIVTKDAADQVVDTYDIIDEIGFSASTGMIAVTRAENTDWDGNQVLTVALDSPTPLVVADATGQVTYTIMDNDSPMVTLERVSGNGPIAEGGSVELRARLTNAPSGGAPETLTVNLDVGTASTVDSGDHNLPASVTINQGETEKKFEVTATDDMLAEFNEMLTIEVGALTYGTPVQTVNKLSTPEKIDLTIPLNDKVAVTGITASDTTEGDDVTVMVTLNRALPANTANGAVMLVLDGTDRTNDVTGSSWDLTSDLKSSNSTSVMITLTEDMLLEGTEQVMLNLVVDSALDDILPAGDRMSGVSFNILDDEDGDISISGKTDYGEAESVVLMVGLASGVNTASDIVVNYEIDLMSAGAGDIVNGANLMRSATIPANQTSVAITIALTDDSVAEKRELFDVFLTGVSSSDAAVNARVAITATLPTMATISILDNEPLAYSFEGTGMVSEDNTAYKVKLTRLGMLPGSGGGAMVAYTVSGSVGSAASAADFVGSAYPSGDFVFTDYAAESAEITLTVVDDGVIEGDEAFQILLTSRSETHDVTLMDNDQPQVVVQRVSGSTPVAEGDPVRLVARLTSAGPSGASEDITVNLATRAGRTGSASDVSFPSSVVIARGSLKETFTVDVESDGLAEFNEVVNIYVEGVNTMTLGQSTSSDTGLRPGDH